MQSRISNLLSLLNSSLCTACWSGSCETRSHLGNLRDRGKQRNVYRPTTRGGTRGPGLVPPPQKKKVLVFIFPRKRTKFGPDSQGGSSPFHLPVKSLIIACVRILVCRVPGLTHAATGKRARPCRVQRGKVGIKKQRGQGYRTKCECSWHVSELAKIWRSLETWSACLDTRDLSRVFRG